VGELCTLFVAVCETLAVLLWLPPDLSHNSLVIWTNFSWRPGCFIKDSLALFGPMNNVCLLDGYFLFTHELWSLAGVRFNHPYPQIILEFRRIMANQLRLKTLGQSKYFLMHRVQVQMRLLQNMGALMETFQTAFPSAPWTVIRSFPSVEKSAGEFWDANLLFAVHGAGCGCLVFMQENTTFLEPASQSCVAYM
jgi:hypothetical protein